MFAGQLNADINHLFEIHYDESLTHQQGIKCVADTHLVLSKRFIFLARIMAAFPEAERECLLTAFSLNPNQRTLEAVRKCAKQLWPTMKCENTDLNADHGQHQHNTRHRNAIEQHLRGLYINNNNNNVCYDPCAMPACLYDNPTLQKCIGQQLAYDLVNLINVLRNKTLTWSMTKWSELEEKCMALMNDSAYRMRHIEMSLPNATKKLTHLDLAQKQLDLMVFHQKIDEFKKIVHRANNQKFEPRTNEPGEFLGFEKMTVAAQRKRKMILDRNASEAKKRRKSVFETPQSNRKRKFPGVERLFGIKKRRTHSIG